MNSLEVLPNRAVKTRMVNQRLNMDFMNDEIIKGRLLLNQFNRHIVSSIVQSLVF